MKASNVVGKRIVAVEHNRWWNEHLGRMETTVDKIILDDGSFLTPYAFETLDCPASTIFHTHRKEKSGDETAFL